MCSCQLQHMYLFKNCFFKTITKLLLNSSNRDFKKQNSSFLGITIVTNLVCMFPNLLETYKYVSIYILKKTYLGSTIQILLQLISLCPIIQHTQAERDIVWMKTSDIYFEKTPQRSCTSLYLPAVAHQIACFSTCAFFPMATPQYG